MITHKTRRNVSAARILLGLLVLAAVLALATPAAASTTDTVVVGLPTSPMYNTYKADWGYTTVESMTDAYAAIDNTGSKITKIIVLEGEWTTPGILPANLTSIQGGSFSEPWKVKLNVTSPLHILTGTTETPFSLAGVAVTSPTNGVLIGGSAVAQLKQCYFANSANSGVSVVGTASVTATNCVFYHNHEDGIRALGNSDTPKAKVSLIHCTFFDNQAIGVNAMKYADVTATNTLVYGNVAGGFIEGDASASVTAHGCNSNNNGGGTNNYSPTDIQETDDYIDVVELLSESDGTWGGKMKIESVINNDSALNKGVATSIYTDFEGDGRNTSSPFIGADEYNADLNIGFWSECTVTTAPIGRQGAHVEIKYSKTLGDLNNSLYLLAQGASPNDSDPGYIKIPLTGGSGYYQGDVPPLKSITGAIVDGDAKFYLRDKSGNILDEKYILEPARTDRDVIVDTVPPVVSSVSFDTSSLVSWWGANTNFGANGVNFGSVQFPYPPMSGSPQMSTLSTSSRAVYAPYDDVISATQPPIYVYNVGSVSNGYATLNDSLYITVNANYVDQDVYTYLGVESGVARTPAGFGPVVDASAIPLPNFFNALWKDSDLPAVWLLENAVFPTGTNILEFTATKTGDTTMSVTWKLEIPVVNADGPIAERYDLLGDLLAMDLARNITVENTAPPLKVAWRSGANLRVDFRTHMYGAWPEIAWSINESNLGIDRANLSNPRPLYCYRIWVSNSFGINNADPLYIPTSTGWSEWTSDALLSSSYFDQSVYDHFGIPIADRYLLVVMAGCDEAGNITPWEGWTWNGTGWVENDPPLILNADESITLAYPDQTSGRNWLRFYVPGKTSQIDTVLYANLYYQNNDNAADVQNLGPLSIVSFPPAGYSLYAEFNARMLINDPELWSQSPYVRVRVTEDGVIAPSPWDYAAVQPAASGTDTVGFSLSPPEVAYLGNPGKVVTYVVNAATTIDGGPYDDSPAMYSFKVVPGSVEEYLRATGGQQPVRQFESR